MYVLFLLLGQFTYTAPEGTWLDYARTGPISENRYVVYEQVGKKGEYDKGARRIVLDADGRFLYEMPQAEDAWFISNGVLGDEDTYFYQTRAGYTLYLWNPNHGMRELVQNGQTPQNKGKIVAMGLTDSGKKIFFVTNYVSGNRGMKSDTLLELVQLQATTPAELFTIETLFTMTQINFEENFEVHQYYAQLTLSSGLPPGKPIYFNIDLEKPLTGANPLTPHMTPVPLINAQSELGFVTYTANSLSNPYEVVEKDGQPLFTFDEKHPHYLKFRDFFQAIGRGKMSYADGVLACQIDQDLVTFDVANKVLRRHRLPGSTNQGVKPLNSKREVHCDARALVVRSATPIATKSQKKPYLEIKLEGPVK